MCHWNQLLMINDHGLGESYDLLMGTSLKRTFLKNKYFGPFPIAVVLFSHVVLGNNFYIICYVKIPILVQVRIHDTK